MRELPSVDALLHRDDAAVLVERHGRTPVLGALRAALDDARARGRGEPAEDLVAAAARLLERPPSLRPVLNATGVIVHTNMGRAPLPSAAIERVARVAEGYSNLELDLETGRRGSRHSHLGPLLA